MTLIAFLLGLLAGSLIIWLLAAKRAARQARRNVDSAESALFDELPVALWEEDFSLARVYMAKLAEEGVSDFYLHFKEFPEDLQHIASLIRIVRVNRTVLRDFSMLDSPDANSLGSFFDESAWEEFRRELVTLWEGRRDTSFEACNVLKDGSKRWFRLHVRIADGHEQDWSRVFVASTDLSEREAAIKALKESEERLRTLIDSMQDIVCFKNGVGQWVGANRQAREVFGLGPSFLGKSNRDLARQVGRLSDVFIAEEEADNAAWEAGVRTRGELEITIPGKGPRVFDVMRMPTFLPDGSRDALVIVGRDYSKRKAAEDKLRESEQRYRAILENSHDGVFIAMDRQFLICNRRLAEMLGVQHSQQLVGQPVLPYFENSWQERVREMIDHPPIDSVQQVLFLASLEKAEQPTEVALRCVPLELDGRSGVLGTVRTVAGETDLRERFSRTAKLEAIGKLAGGIAHDFNNLLTAISGNAELAETLMQSGESPNLEIEEIRKAADRAGRLTRQLLIFSRRRESPRKVIRPHESVLDMEKMLRRLLGERIELIVHPETGDCLMQADPAQIEQVIMNLAVNARDAMKDGGQLHYRVYRLGIRREPCTACGQIVHGDFVCLEAADTGEGIKAADIDHIFEPFFSTKAEGEGTGLGLATIQSIVHQSGGHIVVVSEPGHGAVFRCYFPLVATRATQAGVVATTPAPLGDGQQIMIIEDDRMVRRIAERILQQAGYKVLCAASGEEALTLAAGLDSAPDLIVCDMVMPSMSGPEVLDRLKERWPWVRHFYISGYMPEKEFKSVAINGGNFMAKPFTSQQLLDMTSKVLNLPATETLSKSQAKNA
jgi:two-component system cell cycle sensor histidine kinase/response regulator CckA